MISEQTYSRPVLSLKSLLEQQIGIETLTKKFYIPDGETIQTAMTGTWIATVSYILIRRQSSSGRCAARR